MIPPLAFYCVADERYFLGAVALINSLRLQGHSEPVYVLDRGLSAGQRDLIGPVATVVERSAELPGWLQKTAAPLRHPADVMVLIDSDMIVTRPLGEPAAMAAAGQVVAFVNDRQRFVTAWGELLDLGPARRQPYLSSGLVFLGGRTGREVIELLDDRQRRVEFERTAWRRDERDYPLLYADQDVLNAILCTRVDPGRIVALEQRLAANPPFTGLRLRDRWTLRCAYADGAEPYVLHHFARKPWLSRLRANVYSRLMTRLLLADDVALRLAPELVPLRLRTGFAAGADRFGTDLMMAIPGLRRRLRERRRRSPTPSPAR